MYLTKLCTSHMNRVASSFHELVMWGFPRTDELNPRQKWGVLHRVDGRFLLVQSQIEPVFPALLETQTKLYSPDLELGRFYRFRLAINPVKRSKQGCSPVDPVTWLESRDLGAKFEVCSLVNTTAIEKSRRGGRVASFPLAVATLDGVLECTDTDRLKECIVNGVGRGRAYGCGLLSVVRV